MSKQNSWIKGLDSIRFILALIVFLSHLGNPFHEAWAHSSHLYLRAFEIIWGLVFRGVGAVIAFFIISGFVIHYPHRDAFPDTRSFLIRRWVRIGLPLIVMGSIAGSFHQYSLIPAWSLYCELIYYTLYPVLIRIKLSWPVKFAIAYILSFILILIATPHDLGSLIHQRDNGYSGAYWQLGDLLTWIIGLPCWLLGVVLAQNIDSYHKNSSVIRTWMFRFIVLGAGCLCHFMKFHLFVSYIFSMNLYAILLFFWIRNEILYYKTRTPVAWLEYSGKFSYSLYLCHNVFSFFIVMFLPLTIYSFVPISLLTIFLAFLFYLAVERPSHLFSKRLSQIGRSKKLVTN